MLKNNHTHQMILISLFASLTAVSGYLLIPIPFSPVPITAQTLVVMLAGNLLKPKSAFYSMIIFLLLGIIGLPVFAGGSSGIGAILGPRGGYLISWPISALFISLMLCRYKPTFITIFIINIIGGILLVYFIGALYLSYITKISLISAIASGVLPFLGGDIFKALAVSIITHKMYKVFDHYLYRR